jgi:hypothetical protein
MSPCDLGDWWLRVSWFVAGMLITYALWYRERD